MHLVQILLPLADNAGRRFGAEAYARVRTELSEKFGGITSFTRAPAEGMWKEGGHTNRDDIVVFEVMTRDLDRGWWERYRAGLEQRFDQEAIVMRAIRVEMLREPRQGRSPSRRTGAALRRAIRVEML